MTSWKSGLTLKPNKAIKDAGAAVGGVASSLSATLNGGVTLLDAAGAVLTAQADPLAAGTATLAKQITDAIGDYFDAGYSSLTLHPWQAQVGSGSGLEVRLPFSQLEGRLIAKLQDKNDPRLPSISGESQAQMLAFLLHCPGLSDLIALAEQLQPLLDSADFRLFLRRARQAFALSASRYSTPQPPLAPPWSTARFTDIAAIGTLKQQFEATAKIVNGYAAGSQTALDALKALVSAKKKQLDELNTKTTKALNALSGSIADNRFKSIYLEAAGIKNLPAVIAGAGDKPADHNLLCCAVVFVAKKPLLTPLAELIGLEVP